MFQALQGAVFQADKKKGKKNKIIGKQKNEGKKNGSKLQKRH